MRISLPLASLLVAGAISGCGGTDAPAPSVLTGTAAVGVPIVNGDVNVVCAGGNAITPTKTLSTGLWQVTLSGQTLPCAVRVSGGTVNAAANTTAYHSIAMTLGTVNITPLTDLVVANLAGKDPANWFAAPNLAAIQGVDVDAALGRIKTAWGLSTALGTKNPLTTAFTATNTDPLDNVLEALATARTNAGISTHSALLPHVISISISTPQGFDFATAFVPFASTGTGSSGTGSSSSANCQAGETATVYTTTAANAPFGNGQQVCFNATPTTLSFAGKTLTNPTPNTAVTAPFSAYRFSDAGNVYEVIFDVAGLYEINLSVGGIFNGQFAPGAGTSTGAGSGNTGAAGTGNLTMQVRVNGIASSSITVGNVPMPTTQADFCAGVQNDTNFTSIGTNAGGTLTINNCSYSGNSATINATLALTSPVAMSIPYTVIYTYN